MPAPLFELNSGTKIPAIGLGTWQSKPNEVANAVAYALKEGGYRHIDCAWAYFNEGEVGEGLRKSGVPRSEITSKVWGTYHDRVEECLDQSLANLGTDYLDLYLIHWPVRLIPDGDNVIPVRPDGTRNVDVDWKMSDTWKSMEAMVKKGKVRAIGLSNFSETKVEEILATAEIKPAVDQLELHLYNPDLKLLSYLKSKGIVAQGYSPLGSSNSPLFTDKDATSIAQKYSLQIADVLLGYLVAKGVVVLPKSVNPARITSNIQGAIAAAQKMDKADIELLDSVAARGKQKRVIMPPWGVNLGFDNWP